MTEKNIRAFIFDMDGVIIDSNPWHRTAWEEYTRRHGVEMTDEMQQKMYGKRNDEIVREFLGAQLSEPDVFAHGAAKEALYRELIRSQVNESLVPGIRPFLARHRDLAMAVATNAEPANVDFVLEDTGLRPYFSAVVDGHQVDRPKPHPDIYLKAAAELGVEPEACIVFEDSFAGVEAGLSAGMRVIGITTTHADLQGVSLLVQNFTEPALETWLAERLTD